MPSEPLARHRLPERIARREGREGRGIAVALVDSPAATTKRVARPLIGDGLVNARRLSLGTRAQDRPRTADLFGGLSLPVIVPAAVSLGLIKQRRGQARDTYPEFMYENSTFLTPPPCFGYGGFCKNAAVAAYTARSMRTRSGSTRSADDHSPACSKLFVRSRKTGK